MYALCTKIVEFAAGRKHSSQGGKSVYKKAGEFPFFSIADMSTTMRQSGSPNVAFVESRRSRLEWSGTAVAARDLLARMITERFKLWVGADRVTRYPGLPCRGQSSPSGQHVADNPTGGVLYMADYLHKLVLSALLPKRSSSTGCRRAQADGGLLEEQNGSDSRRCSSPRRNSTASSPRSMNSWRSATGWRKARVVSEGTRDRLLDSLLHEALLAGDATAERPTQFNWLSGGERHD